MPLPLKLEEDSKRHVSHWQRRFLAYNAAAGVPDWDKSTSPPVAAVAREASPHKRQLTEMRLLAKSVVNAELPLQQDGCDIEALLWESSETKPRKRRAHHTNDPLQSKGRDYVEQRHLSAEHFQDAVREDAGVNIISGISPGIQGKGACPSATQRVKAKPEVAGKAPLSAGILDNVVVGWQPAVGLHAGSLLRGPEVPLVLQVDGQGSPLQEAQGLFL